MCKLTVRKALIRPDDLINEQVHDSTSERERDDLILPVARDGESERVIEVSGAFLYFVRSSRGRKVVTTLALEGAQDTSPRKVTSRVPGIAMSSAVRKV